MLHNHGNRHLIGHLMSGGDDFFDAGECSCGGISKEVSRSRCWFCSRLDVLVRMLPAGQILKDTLIATGLHIVFLLQMNSLLSRIRSSFDTMTAEHS